MGQSVGCPNCILGSTGDVLQSYESGYADVIHAAVNAFRSGVTLGQARMYAWLSWLPTIGGLCRWMSARIACVSVLRYMLLAFQVTGLA